jgi:tetratricopeptide (TPR) repeat protein
VSYTLIMSRCLAALLLLAVTPVFVQNAAGQQSPQLKRRGDTASTQPLDKDGLPPEEDNTVGVNKEYGFNPLQAHKEIAVGNQYFKKGKYRAAAGRYEEATKWNSGDPEAWLRLGEAQEHLKDVNAARDAYTKYLALASDAKNSDVIRKRVEKLK